METDIVILGKGDAIVCMILDNLNSNGIYGNISIYNNLSLPICIDDVMYIYIYNIIIFILKFH
jgi:hypothetical protein